MKVNEIFISIQGEGPDCGLPAVFLRLSGCNVHCLWCDSTYANEGSEMSLDEVVDKIKQLTEDNGIDYLIITGGEPLLQADEVHKLVKYLYCDFYIAIETNGTQPIPKWSDKVIWDVDRKCPSSGVTNFDLRWCSVGESAIKFVVSDEQDLKFVQQNMMLSEFKRHGAILVSPAITGPVELSCEREWQQRVWQFCVENNLRFSLQIHKVLFGNKKGV